MSDGAVRSTFVDSDLSVPVRNPVAARAALESIFTVEVTQPSTYQQGRVIVRGEFGRGTVHLFESAIDLLPPPSDEHPDGGSDSVCLDLGEVTFMDLGGISALERAYKQIQARGRDLKVIGPSALGPRRLLNFALDQGWLAAALTPEPLAHAGASSAESAISRRIGAAMGILMATLRCTDEQAFEMLTRASQTANQKLQEVAEIVICTGGLPEPADETASPTRVPTLS